MWQKFAGLFLVAALVLTAISFSVPATFSANAANWINDAFGDLSVKPRYRKRAIQPARDVRRQGYAIGRIDRQLKPISTSPSKKRRLYRIPKASNSIYAKSRGSYRTMCVRTCDGFFFPVSFATSKNRLKKDEKVCKSSCGAPASLYYYPNPGGEIEDMVSYRGNKKYKKLKYAFLYKKKFIASCRCQPEPWTTAAKQKHKNYAKLEIVERQKKLASLKKKKVRKKRLRKRRAKSRRKGRRHSRRLSRQNRRALHTVGLKKSPRRRVTTRRVKKRTYRVRRGRRARPTRRWTF